MTAMVVFLLAGPNSGSPDDGWSDEFTALDLKPVTAAPNKWSNFFETWGVRYLVDNSDDAWKTYDERVETGRTRTAKQVLEQSTSPVWPAKTRYLHDVSGGTLKLRTYSVAVADRVDTNNFPYISGMISTEATPSLAKARGYWETKLRFNSLTKSHHLSVWLIPSSGAWFELDILEVWNSGGSVGPYYWTANTHAEDPPLDQTNYRVKDQDGWHVVGFEWTDDLMNWYMDGILVRQQANYLTADRLAHYMISWECSGVTAGDPDGTTVFPSEVEIDRVSYYPTMPEAANDSSSWRYCGQTAPAAVLGSTAIVFTEPLGSREGDLQVVQISYRANIAFATPSGWTLATQNSGGNRSFNGAGTQRSSVAIFYRVRGSSAGTLTFSKGAGTPDEGLDVAMGVMSLYRPPTGLGAYFISAANAADAAYAGAAVTIASQMTAVGDLVVAALAASDEVYPATTGALSSTNITSNASAMNRIGNVADGWQLSYQFYSSSGADGGIAVGHARVGSTSTGSNTITFAGGNGHSAAIAIFRAA